MKYLVDFDWNRAFVYDEKNQVVFQEPVLCLRDLRTTKLVALGSTAWEKLSENNNWLAIVPIEKRHLLSREDLLLFLDYLVEKYDLKDFAFVNRYQWKVEDFAFELIDEINFIQRFTQTGIYLDLRNNETLIYNFDQQKLTIIPQGLVKILNYLNRYFYLNFNATLNTKKTLKLVDDLASKPVKIVECRSYQDKKDIPIKINQNKLLTEVRKFNAQVKSLYWKDQPQIIYKTKNYQKVFFFDY